MKKLKKSISYILVIVLLAGVIGVSDFKNAKAEDGKEFTTEEATATYDEASPRVVGYTSDTPSMTDYSALTHCILSSISYHDGEMSSRFPDACIQYIVNRCHQNGVKAMISIGGKSGRFTTSSDPFGDQEMRTNTINQIIEYVNRLSLDGVDLDIESDEPYVWSNFEIFASELSERLKARGKLLTMAVAPWFAESVPDGAYQYFDFLNLIAYDYDNPGPDDYVPKSHFEEMVSYYRARGISDDKLVNGVSFYGYGPGCEANYQTITSRVMEDVNIDFGLIARNDIRQKAEISKSYGGIMMWELRYDRVDSDSLLSVIKSVIPRGSTGINDGESQTNQSPQTNPQGGIVDPEIPAPRGMHYEGNGEESYLFGWYPVEDVHVYNVYVNGAFATCTTTPSITFSKTFATVLFPTPGEYNIAVQAVKQSIKGDRVSEFTAVLYNTVTGEWSLTEPPTMQPMEEPTEASTEEPTETTTTAQMTQPQSTTPQGGNTGDNSGSTGQYPNWSPDNVHYQPGDLVQHQGKVYECIYGHISNDAWTPDAVLLLWKERTDLVESNTDSTTQEQEGNVDPNLKAPEGLCYAGNQDLPYMFAWLWTEGAEGYIVSVNGAFATFVTVTYAILLPTLFPTPGVYTIAVQSFKGGRVSASTEIFYNTATGEWGPMEELTEQPTEPQQKETTEETTIEEATTEEITIEETTTEEITIEETATEETSTEEITTEEITTEEITTEEITTEEITTEEITTEEITTEEITTKEITTEETTTETITTESTTEETTSEVREESSSKIEEEVTSNTEKTTGETQTSEIESENITTEGSTDSEKNDIEKVVVSKKKITSIQRFKEKNYHTLKVWWKNAGKNVKYEVLRSIKKKGKYKRLAIVTDTTYFDRKVKAGTKYYYKIRVIDGDRSNTSKAKSVKVQGYPSKPPLKVSANRKSLKIKWGILQDNSRAIEIYVRSKKGGYSKFTRINITTNIKKSKKKKGSIGLESSVSGLKSGAIYEFKARTYAKVKRKKVYSKWSAIKKVKIK